MLNSVTIWRCGVANRAGCGQCHTQMDGQWETWQPVAASRFVPQLSLHYITDTLPSRSDAGRHLQLSLIAWVYGKWRGSRRRSCRRAFCLQAESLLSNRQRKDDLWIEALSRLQRLRGRRIRRKWECQLYVTAEVGCPLSVRSTDFHAHDEESGRIKPGFGGRGIETLKPNSQACCYLQQININCWRYSEHLTATKETREPLLGDKMKKDPIRWTWSILTNMLIKLWCAALCPKIITITWNVTTSLLSLNKAN